MNPLRSLRLAVLLALRDLRGGAGSLRLLLAGIAIGVAVIAATGSISAGISQAVRQDAHTAIGGDISLRLFHQAADPDQRAFLSAIGSYSEIAELRARAGGPAAGASTLVEIRAVDAAWPLYGTVDLEPPLALDAALERRDGIWGAAVEPALLAALGLARGDMLQVGPVRFQIRALLRAEPGGDARPFALGPRIVVHRGAIEGTDLAAPGAPIYWYSLLRLAPGVEVAEATAAIERQFPDAGWRIVAAADGPPGMERMVEIGRVLSLLAGVSVLLIGGVGVACAVSAHLADRTATVAILRSLGATGRVVTTAFFLQIMLVACLAVALGLAAGAAVAAIPGMLWQEAISGFDFVQPRALAIAAAFGLLAAGVFASWSLARLRDAGPQSLFRDIETPLRPATRTRLLVALLGGGALAALILVTTAMPFLALLFAAAAAVAAALFLLLGRGIALAAGRGAHRCGPLLRLALGSLSRPGAATVPVVAALGLGLSLLVVVRTLEATAVHHIEQTVPNEAPDLALVNVAPAEADALDGELAALPGVERLERAPFLHARLSHVARRRLVQGDVPRDVAWAVRGDRGVSWRADPPPGSDIVAGAWWLPDHAGPQLASVDAVVARRLGLAVGDELTLNVQGEPVTATVANLRRIDWTRLRLDFPILLSPPQTVPPHREIAALWVDPGATEPVERLLAERFPAVATLRVAPALEKVEAAVRAAADLLGALSAAALLAAVIVFAGCLATTWRRRLRDMVLLKILGARPRQLMLAGMLELAILGAVTALAAGLLGTLGGWLVVTRLSPDGWVFRPLIPLAIAGAVVAGTALAGLWLPRRVLRGRPADMLRNHGRD